MIEFYDSFKICAKGLSEDMEFLTIDPEENILYLYHNW